MHSFLVLLALAVAAASIFGGFSGLAIFPGLFLFFAGARAVKFQPFLANLILWLIVLIAVLIAAIAMMKAAYFVGTIMLVFGLGGFAYVLWVRMRRTKEIAVSSMTSVNP